MWVPCVFCCGILAVFTVGFSRFSVVNYLLLVFHCGFLAVLAVGFLRFWLWVPCVFCCGILVIFVVGFLRFSVVNYLCFVVGLLRFYYCYGILEVFYCGILVVFAVRVLVISTGGLLAGFAMDILWHLLWDFSSSSLVLTSCF